MPADNERFGAMAALPRRQFCGKLHVTTPQQVQWEPPLRKAVRAVGCNDGKSAVEKADKVLNIFIK
jgi:hypothetical protein